MKKTKLILKNGVEFEGVSPFCPSRGAFGEVVFTTGMCGYPETLTDPSYSGQIITFTYPLIGNYGTPSSNLWESEKIHALGAVVSEECEHWSHYSGQQSLLEWLEEQGVPIILGVDTRALTKILRESGTLLGGICPETQTTYNFIDPHDTSIISKVSIPEPITYGTGKKKVILVDCGMKSNILRSLMQFPIQVKRVPFDYDYSSEDFDAVFLSNGPGNPEMCPETIQILKKAMTHNKPIFGICLGVQIMALAAGAKTYKLLYGHRGHNQPCLSLETGKSYITSQNHGYAIDESSLPSGWKVSFRNLNDQSIEGIAHEEKPFFAVQFHPEAAPGPTDTQWLFEKFYHLLTQVSHEVAKT